MVDPQVIQVAGPPISLANVHHTTGPHLHHFGKESCCLFYLSPLHHLNRHQNHPLVAHVTQAMSSNPPEKQTTHHPTWQNPSLSNMIDITHNKVAHVC